MKKLILMASVAMSVIVSSCDDSKKSVIVDNVDNAETEALQTTIEEREQEIAELLGVVTDIQLSLDSINATEGIVRNSNGELNKSAIRENMHNIQDKLAANRLRIEELQQKLQNSNIKNAELKNKIEQTIAMFTRQLESKDLEIEDLRAQLADMNVVIETRDTRISELEAENNEVREQKQEMEQVAHNQDQQLNTAWYVYGTTKELREQGILNNGDVLKGDYNKSYFTKIDIRSTNIIPLDSKKVELLTNHPNGSYEFIKDTKGLYTLRITDANKFWSVSKYLVVKVK